MSDCIFCKIASGQTETTFLYSDSDVVAFNDLHPVAPVHVIIIPRRCIKNANFLSTDTDQLIGKMVRVGGQIAEDQGISDSGYRLVTNTNQLAGQTIYHLHFHLIGSRVLGPIG